jgi:hypothetical protein
MTIFNAEESIFREMPLIIAYYFKDNVRYTQKGYPNAASGRKMAKSLLRIFRAEVKTDYVR